MPKFEAEILGVSYSRDTERSRQRGRLARPLPFAEFASQEPGKIQTPVVLFLATFRHSSVSGTLEGEDKQCQARHRFVGDGEIFHPFGQSDCRIWSMFMMPRSCT